MRSSPRGATALIVEELFGFVGAEPFFEQLEVLRVGADFFKRYLMGTPGAFDLKAIHKFRTGPAFGGAQDEHGPTGAGGVVLFAGLLLDAADFGVDGVERLGHASVHLDWIVAFEEVRHVAVALKQ
jgi:hypothetical protein